MQEYDDGSRVIMVMYEDPKYAHKKVVIIIFSFYKFSKVDYAPVVKIFFIYDLYQQILGVGQMTIKTFD